MSHHDTNHSFAKPPFERQPQPQPGLCSALKPHADHGETHYKGHGRLAGKKALITGGDSGIGRAAAIAYAREGADVAINYLPSEESDAQEVIALIEAEGRKAVAIAGDIRDEAFCVSLIQQAHRHLGGLNVLVNNAAQQQLCYSIDELTTEAFDSTFKTNVYAMFWLSKEALRHMECGSVIINSTSVQAASQSEILLDYASTKACIVAFTKSLAKQVAHRGIRVNAVAPGPFWTALQWCGGQPVEAVVEFGSATPMQRPGQPVEIAPLYVALASDETSYCSGQVWGADGGMGIF